MADSYGKKVEQNMAQHVISILESCRKLDNKLADDLHDEKAKAYYYGKVAGYDTACDVLRRWAQMPAEQPPLPFTVVKP